MSNEGRPPFELTAPSAPKRNERLTDLSDLVGQTILAVFEQTISSKYADLVFVTESGCWLPLIAEQTGCGDDEIDISVVRHTHGPEQTIADFVPAWELFNQGVITSAEKQFLEGEEAKRKEAERQEKAARLRAQLAALEKGQP